MGDEKHTYLGGQLNRKSIKGIKIERERERAERIYQVRGKRDQKEIMKEKQS